jgi:hypothetical protein
MHTWDIRALSCTGLLLALANFSPSSSAAALPAYGGCAAPSGQGVNVCQPLGSSEFTYQISGPVQVIAAATSGRGQVKSMELWVDGKKVSEADGTPFDQTIDMGVGTHDLSVVEIDTTGASAKSAPLKIDVVEKNDGPDCSAPDHPGVNVCSPDPNGCNSQSWVNISAVGKGKSGKVSRMELWAEGDKIANFPGDRIDTNLIMLYGTITINEVDSKGNTLGSTFFFNGPC